MAPVIFARSKGLAEASGAPGSSDGPMSCCEIFQFARSDLFPRSCPRGDRLRRSAPMGLAPRGAFPSCQRAPERSAHARLALRQRLLEERRGIRAWRRRELVSSRYAPVKSAIGEIAPPKDRDRKGRKKAKTARAPP